MYARKQRFQLCVLCGDNLRIVPSTNRRASLREEGGGAIGAIWESAGSYLSLVLLGRDRRSGVTRKEV
jgi:hypothetical protein